MDAVSYSHSAKQAQRIEKFIKNPDSNSGIVTVPKVIGAGENITIPAGRVAVLPNVQIDGTLTVEGEVFIPAGSTVDMGNGLTINGEKVVMSVPTSYHLLQGNLAVDNTIITQGFNTTLYTGNGTTQSINTGIDMATQWGNDASEMFGGLVWTKSRSSAISNILIDTVRGNKSIFSNETSVESSSSRITSFNNNGFTLTSDASINANLVTYASWNFQTTHRISGVTNHGKPYTCHYNPYTGFTIVKYEGSGLAGHEIQHHLGRKLGFATVKCISTINDWWSSYLDSFGTQRLKLNSTDASTTETTVFSNNTNDNVIISTSSASNATGNYYIMYGWANSYFDEANKLIGNYEIGVYQGTGASGNKVTTRGKPAWVMIKRLDSTGNWSIQDNLRNSFDNLLFVNLSQAEISASPDQLNILSDGFMLTGSDAGYNASGGQYLYMVAYDTNSDGGGSFYPKATDTANVQINNALIPIAKGADTNGLKNVMVSKNETITGLNYTAGKNYIYYDGNGNKGVKAYKPRYLSSELVRRFAGEQPDYYDVEKNKWFNTDTGSELVVNGKFSSGVAGWDVVAPSTISVSNGTLLLTRVSNSLAYYAQTTVTTVVGKKYKVRCSYSSAGAFILNASTVSYGDNLGSYVSLSGSTGIAEITFVAQSTTTYIVLGSSGLTSTASVDNVTCYAYDIVPTSEIPEGRNYLNHIVHADNDGGVLYVEELPKIEYKAVIKANEYQGKNACTAWVNFDGTTTPPTIRDSYNVSAVIRTAAGTYDVYFKEPMDNINYSIDASQSDQFIKPAVGSAYKLNKCAVISFYISNVAGAQTMINGLDCNIQIFGGKN